MIYEDVAGQIEIRYRARAMRWTELTASAGQERRSPVPAAVAPPARRERPHVSVNQPWRHAAVEGHYAFRQLAKDRRAWERTQP